MKRNTTFTLMFIILSFVNTSLYANEPAHTVQSCYAKKDAACLKTLQSEEKYDKNGKFLDVIHNYQASYHLGLVLLEQKQFEKARKIFSVSYVIGEIPEAKKQLINMYTNGNTKFDADDCMLIENKKCGGFNFEVQRTRI